MKRLVLSLLLVLGMTIPMATPANAIFGLSKCEKVKKQILQTESLIESFPNKMRITKKKTNYLYAIGTDEIQVLTAKSQKMLKELNQNDPIYLIWKLGFNNSDCFTNTQKLRIKTLGKETISDYFGGMGDRIWKTDSFCRNVAKNILGDDYMIAREKCSTEVQKWYWSKEYSTIYSY